MNKVNYIIPVSSLNGRKSGIGLLWLILLVLSSSCKQELTIKPFYEGIYEGMNESISEYVLSRDDFSMFGELLIEGSLDQTLTAYNPHGNDYTLFLPTNEAIESYINSLEKYDSFQDLLDDHEFVNILVRYHVVNRAIQKNDFPYGALTDTTLSGDQLTVGFTGDLDSIILRVNNEASIIQHDIELINGYVHVIDHVLSPVIRSSYEWLRDHEEYSIFTEALEATGLRDTFIIEDDINGKYTSNTLLIESNEVFNEDGISTLDDLKEKYSEGDQNYTSITNGLYQFVAYHILEGKQFLNNFEGENSNFNSYGSLPVWINGSGLEIAINTGIAVFDSIITSYDTTIINYIGINYDLSNIATKNGALHFINNVMEPFRPAPKRRIFQFYEDPIIDAAHQNFGTYTFNIEDIEDFTEIRWGGVDEITYYYSSSALTDVWQNDYLEIDGNFSITYQIPKILPGNYMFEIRANDEYYNNATVQILLDGKSIGDNIDLSSNRAGNSSFYSFSIGIVSFANYEKHELRIQTLIPGRFTWDAVVFNPQ